MKTFIVFCLLIIINVSNVFCFEVTDFFITKQVIDRKPIQTDTVFYLKDKILFAYCRLSQITEIDTIHYNWWHNDKMIHHFTTTIKPSARWRSWSEKKIYQNKGSWKVTLTNNKGEILAKTKFVVR